MQAALAMYGRDRSARWEGEDGSVAIACQLMRLVPEDRFDRQPLADETGRFHLVADARIDNRTELAADLAIAPERLQSMSDSALILAAWTAWGAASIERLYGDFAFAVWDLEQRHLHLARDFPGGRPLFYARTPNGLAFASMAKGLHALPDVAYAANITTVRDLLGFVPMKGTGSFFAGVDRVEPGTHVCFAAGGERSIRRWYVPPPQLPDTGDPRPQIEAFRAVFDRAVADRLRGNAGFASLLSGGLDSTAVTTSAAMKLAETGQRLTSFTHAPHPDARVLERPDRFGDESQHARRVAELYPNIDHVIDHAPGRMIGDDRDARFHYQEYPSLNLCNEVWMTELARQAGALGRGTVVVTGAWGNMTISDHGLERLNALLHGGKLLRWLIEAFAVLRRGAMTPLALANWSLRPFLRRKHFEALQRRFGRPTGHPLNVSLLRADQVSEDRYDSTGKTARSRRDRILGLFWQQELAALSNKGLLARFGVDYRDPTSDRRLIDLCLALPDSLFLRHGQPKWLYRQAFHDRLPTTVLEERRKGLQAADWASRLAVARDDLLDEALRAQSNLQAQTLFDLDGLERLGRSIPDPDKAAPSDDLKYRLQFLRTLSATHFLRKVQRDNS
ncbi:asparagine synthetase B [Blastomonas sp. AAP53]|uniref:asparagine synthetase B family protein n=1 Tax=Blastomonas sp. AAP53 TaxID=1248760 RepID=UPI00037ECA33|nr:asparagine synthetase B [Blastomonas sp. AAP53]